MDSTMWNAVLSLLVAILGWVLREKSAELQRITILLNKTREELAKEYVTKVEVHADINRVLDRLDRLESKIDRLMESAHAIN
jgi:Tfp pilus assembly protein PilO